MKKLFIKLVAWPRQLILWPIVAYQKILSPDHSWVRHFYPHGFCKFYPTCSEYSYQIIKKRGLLVGVPLAILRIIRCNPWNKGGVDLPS